jgi:hypothetical protein
MEEDQTIMLPSDHTREDLKTELDGSTKEWHQVQCKLKSEILVDTAWNQMPTDTDNMLYTEHVLTETTILTTSGLIKLLSDMEDNHSVTTLSSESDRSHLLVNLFNLVNTLEVTDTTSECTTMLHMTWNNGGSSTEELELSDQSLRDLMLLPSMMETTTGQDWTNMLS